ncbi:hypothetical protein TCAL_13142, partial [Tigriopus californicus]
VFRFLESLVFQIDLTRPLSQEIRTAGASRDKGRLLIDVFCLSCEIARALDLIMVWFMGLLVTPGINDGVEIRGEPMFGGRLSLRLTKGPGGRNKAVILDKGEDGSCFRRNVIVRSFDVLLLPKEGVVLWSWYWNGVISGCSLTIVGSDDHGRGCSFLAAYFPLKPVEIAGALYPLLVCGAPYPDPVDGAPYPDPVDGAPYPDPVDGAPYPDPVDGAPYPDPVDGVPYPDPVDGVPYPEPVAGAPYPELDCGAPYPEVDCGAPYPEVDCGAP